MTKWTARGSGHLQQFYSTPVATQVSGMARGWAGLTLGFKQTAFRRGALDMLHAAGWRVSTPSLHTIKHIWSYFLIFHWCRCKFCILMQRWKHVFFRIFFQPTKMHLKVKCGRHEDVISTHLMNSIGCKLPMKSSRTLWWEQFHTSM